MIKTIISLLLFVLSSLCAYTQQETKKDTTLVLKNDDYSNFRRSNKMPSQAITIPYDTTNQNSKPVLIAFDYKKMANLADSNYKKKQFRTAIDLYTTAFKKNNDLGLVRHRYNLACCYVMTKNLDSAFIQLFRIAEKGKYFNYSEIEAEPCFKTLQSDSRWTKLIGVIKKNAQDLIDDADSKNQGNN
jgi:uncharacterized protein YxeA